jgi:hypothetical protein
MEVAERLSDVVFATFFRLYMQGPFAMVLIQSRTLPCRLTGVGTIYKLGWVAADPHNPLYYLNIYYTGACEFL